jgi:hypothetical protein
MPLVYFHFAPREFMSSPNVKFNLEVLSFLSFCLLHFWVSVWEDSTQSQDGPSRMHTFFLVFILAQNLFDFSNILYHSRRIRSVVESSYLLHDVLLLVYAVLYLVEWHEQDRHAWGSRSAVSLSSGRISSTFVLAISAVPLYVRFLNYLVITR